MNNQELNFANCCTSRLRNNPTSVTMPTDSSEPRSASFVTVAGLMSTDTSGTDAGRMLPVAIECSIEATMIAKPTTTPRIGDNTSGGAFGYRMSKVALNMASRSMALALRGERIISVVVNPGWVQTDMGGPGAPTPAADSARGILALVERLKLEDSGEFWDYRGSKIEW